MATDAFKWVLLRHELPNGEWHYDWLLSRPDAPTEGLLSFRIMCDPSAAGGRFEAIATPDHRRLYLNYEGEISGGRGAVRRINEGIVERIQRFNGRIEIELATPRSISLTGHETGELWIFDVGA